MTVALNYGSAEKRLHASASKRVSGPFPLEVTQHSLLHIVFADGIKKLNEAELKPMDIVTKGSPRQNLHRVQAHGIKGERSGLFVERINVAKKIKPGSPGTGQQ